MLHIETVRGPWSRLTCCRPAPWGQSLYCHQGGPSLHDKRGPLSREALCRMSSLSFQIALFATDMLLQAGSVST